MTAAPSPLAVNVPTATPLVLNGSPPQPPWLQFFLKLVQRTGGSAGVDSQQALDAATLDLLG